MKKVWFGLVLVVAMLFITSCMREYDKPEYVDIKSNETAFLIPLTGKTSDQSTLLSESYLQKNQVATKRVQITHEWRQTGRNDTLDGLWVPNVKLIVVDRTPVSVTWSASDITHRINVESGESIGFTPGVSTTVMIEESDAAKYLYKYAGKSLKDVVDSDVNNYYKGRFSAYFSILPLETAKMQKQIIFDKVFKEAVEHFKPWGLTIAQLGQTDGLTYDNPKIQEQIDNLATAQSGVAVQNQVNLKQDLENKRLRSVAETENYNQKLANAAIQVDPASYRVQQELKIRQTYADAALALAKNDKLQLPSVVPENTWQQMGLNRFFNDPTVK
jgi:hypothetical protein